MTQEKQTTPALFIERCYRDEVKWPILKNLAYKEHNNEYIDFFLAYLNFLENPGEARFKEIYDEFIAPERLNITGCITFALADIHKKWNEQGALNALYDTIMHLDGILKHTYSGVLEERYKIH